MKKGFFLISICFFSSPLKAQITGTDVVPVEKLEEQYWAAKDTHYSVVQNRTYSKNGRWAVGLGLGNLINDGFSSGTVSHLDLQYFLSEQWDLEVVLGQYSLRNNETTEFFRDRFGVTPDHNKNLSTFSLGFNWSPIYAKMNLFDARIIYFDMSIGAFLGTTQYEQQRTEGGIAKSTPHFGIQFSQLFFFSHSFAVRMHFRNTWSSQERIRYNLPAGQTERALGTSAFHETTMIFGLVYFIQ